MTFYVRNQNRIECLLDLEKIENFQFFLESKQNQAIRETKKSRKDYHEHALAYVDTLLSIEEEKKYELVENFAQIAGVRRELLFSETDSKHFRIGFNSPNHAMNAITSRMTRKSSRR